jgi:hypothetical protein
MADEPNSTPRPWVNFLGQYIAPTVIASFIASALSIYTAINAHNKELRDYGTEFEKSLTADSVMSAFKGNDVAEEKAAAELLALQSLAVTAEQRRSVLLVGGRLLNANTDTEATGQAAARLLTILIDEDEKDGDRQLVELTKSDSFLNLVTAGYSNDYYNDDYSLPNYVWPTLNGDQPVTHDAKLQLLLRLTPKNYDGWIHVQTLATSYVFERQVAHAAATPPSPHPPGQEKPPPAITQKTAQNFLDTISAVSIGRDLSHAENVLAEYVIFPPNAPAKSQESKAGYVDAKSLLAGPPSVTTLLLLKARLLRDRPPVEYVNPDGTFFRGSLGRITGVVPPGGCVQLVEPAQPVLAFVGSDVAKLANVPKQKWVGLMHIWIHVRPSNNCGAF